MSEQEDHAWKLKVTSQLASQETKLERLTDEVEDIKDEVTDMHETVASALYGSASDKGLSNRYLDLNEKLESIKRWGIRILPWLLLVCIILGDRLSPLIFDYIYDKTHFRLFYSPVKEFKEEKKTVHVKHYHIRVQEPAAQAAD